MSLEQIRHQAETYMSSSTSLDDSPKRVNSRPLAPSLRTRKEEHNA